MKNLGTAVIRFAAAALLAGAIGSLAAAAQAADKVKVGVFRVSSSLPYFIARDLGYFRELDIEPETITLMGGPLNVAALITGQIEVSVVLVTLEGLNANLKKPGAAMYIAMNGQNATHRMEQFVVRAGLADKVKSLADFKGLKLMSAPGPANLNTAKGILAKVGLKDGDYTRSARHGPAYQRHEGRHLRRRLHARAQRLGDEPARLRQDGGSRRDRQIRARRSGGRPVRGRLRLSADFIAKRPDVAKRFAAAWARALDLIKADPQAARKHLLKNTLTPENVVDSVPMLGYVMVKDMTPKQIDDLQTFADFGHDVGVVPEKVDVRKYLQPF